MSKPNGLVSLKDGLNVAIQVMRENGNSSAFVVDRKRQLQGIITIDQAIEGMKQKKSLQETMSKDVNTVHPEEYVQDLIQQVLDSKYPLVVTDEEGTMKGMILRVHVLASLISDPVEEPEQKA